MLRARKLHSARRASSARRALLAIGGLALVAVITVGCVNAWMILTYRNDATAEVSDLRKADAALVLGALVNPDGSMSAMLQDRVDRAVELWRSGKVESIIVSGDHGQWTYDEPTAMRLALQRAGVPDRKIFTDHAGFDTWASVVRARKVFEARSVVLVTQEFHLPRALYLANAAGLEAQGLVADRQGYGRQIVRSRLREAIARVKAVGSATFDAAVLLGPRHPVSGDGRSTWGPRAPA
jgi:SanA protein